LKAEQRFLMHRALARIARGPLLKDEVRQLDRFLDQHPEVLRPLEKRPALIADSAFLSSHAEFGSFLTNHPALFTAFVDRAPGAKKKAAKD
jgi:hypothetical protein